MSTENHYDVVVVGARAAGAATAMLLARAGRRVLVLDRSAYGRDTLSTHALMRAGVVQLHRWGVLERIVAVGTPPIRRTTFTFANDQIVIGLKPSHGVDALYAPRRTVLDPALVDAAVEAGAEVRFGVTVTGLRWDGTGRVNGVDARDEHGRRLTFAADMVVGADGLRSVVAREVAAPVERQGVGATSCVYGYWAGVETDGYEWMFRRDAMAGIIPTNDGMACVFAVASPQRIARGGVQVLRDVLRDASPSAAERVEAGTAPSGVRSFPGLPGYMRRAYGPGWALVGDAGYWKDPIGAHGLTDALRDAELLARAIVQAASADLTEGEALARYQDTRDRLSLPLFDVVEELARQQWTDADIGGLLLRLSSAMAEEVDEVAALDGVGAR